MFFEASNKANVTSLMAILKAKGVYPNDLPTCTAIKQALDGKDISDLEQAVDQLLSRVGQDSPATEGEPEVAPTEESNATPPVVSASPQPPQKAASKPTARPPTIPTFSTRSRFKKAQRETIRLKLAIEGPSGSGKTLGALMIAAGLADGDWDKVAFIDSENGSASYYVGSTFEYQDKDEQGNRTTGKVTIGEFQHCVIEAPFSPQNYVSAINDAMSIPGIEVIIIDSFSHEWDGPGGCLEIQQDKGGRYADWKPVKAMHKQCIDTMLHAKAHVIATMRSKTEYLQTEENGKKTIKKVGMKAIQQEQAEYEFGIVFTVDQETHRAVAGKDRTNIFGGLQVPFLLSPRVGVALKNWAQLEPVANSTEEA